MTIRKYSSRAQQTTLSENLLAGNTTMIVASGANLMGGKTPAVGETYTVVINPDTALEEIVDVTNYASGNTLNIQRPVDGSTAVNHSAGAVVRHMVIGRDLTEANNHIENVTAAHGLTIANVVSTTDVTPKVSTNMIIDSAVTSAKIADGTIVNADINASAQIAYGKLNLTNTIVDGDINTSAAIAKTKISGTAITAADTGTVTSTMIADGAIVNADINASAAIDWTKIAPSSTVSATELGYLDGVTSAVQTQINTKLATATAASTYAPLASPALTGTPTAPTATAGTATTQLATTAFVGTATSVYAPLANPALTGVPTAPTAAANTNTTQIATTAYVQTEINDLIAAAPGALDTLDELAAALGDNASFSTTVTNSIATKLPLAGGTMTGAIAMGTNKITGLGTPTLTGDAATKDYADLKLALAGGTMSGAIAMGTNKVTGLGTPTVGTDAATKAYADTMLPLAGGTMSGALAMGTNKITGLGTPTVGTDAATKAYADAILVGAPGNLTGPITSVGNLTSIASQTGTGTKFVVDNTPTLITPVLGVATATSINGTTIPSSKTLVATDSTAYVVPSQTGNSGKALTTDGTTSSWSATINGTAIPAAKTLVATDSTAFVVPSQTTHAGKYLTTNGTTSSWAAIPDTSLYAINPQTASYTLVIADSGKLVEMNVATGNTLTVPLDSSVNFSIGAQINILQTGAGQVTITPTAGVTITGTPGLKLRSIWSSGTLIKRAANTWVLVGDLSA